MFHHQSWKPIYFWVKKSKVKCQGYHLQKNIAMALLWVLASSCIIAYFCQDILSSKCTNYVVFLLI